eukprot:CAMPEP_0180428080 /NCGR_PEP_ID=MMETSP1036_2-20121128/6649_1 /TAXON_ID=632150 /ORGANISM="Azadinium spinosum, Strain 3D9" /LENGTH=101 /DNA_ID=CAMNT_0022433699 /DNA_START=65 /DNA_END=367 /DNA_ORIENTATION=-
MAAPTLPIKNRSDPAKVAGALSSRNKQPHSTKAHSQRHNWADYTPTYEPTATPTPWSTTDAMAHFGPGGFGGQMSSVFQTGPAATPDGSKRGGSAMNSGYM